MMKNTKLFHVVFLIVFIVLTFMGSVCVDVWSENDTDTSSAQSFLSGSHDPKTETMIEKIQSLGLSLHPAQHYEKWEIPSRNVPE